MTSADVATDETGQVEAKSAGASSALNGSSRQPRELRQLLDALQAVRAGNFAVRLPSDWPDLMGRVAESFNDIVASNQRMAQQLVIVGQTVGRDGQTRQRVRLGLANGSWAGMEASVNTLIDDLLWPTTEATRAIEAVAQGNLLQTMRLDVDGRPLRGEFLRSANIVNSMIKQLGIFTSEVTRVAREVGTDGKLGGQAQISEVTGVWKELTDSVNSMASNLTGQVRNIAEVTIAVANGDLSKKITVDVRGEILLLKEAINTMVDQLRSFAAEVTRVAREVGTEGRLGGQAVVPGVAGTWKDLTDNVNLLAANLTTQVRNIAEVTTAVARGDLSRKITVDVQGEILELKNTINTMVDQLNAFASEVTRVAREVGTEGRLGGQANVPGAGGTDEILHKPGDLAQAAIQLDRLRGRTHKLHSGVALARNGTVLWSAVATAHLSMRDFSTADRDAVLALEGDGVLGSVGGYRLEGPSIRLFDAIEGDYFTILGLPLLPLLAALRLHVPDIFGQ